MDHSIVHRLDRAASRVVFDALLTTTTTMTTPATEVAADETTWPHAEARDVVAVAVVR